MSTAIPQWTVDVTGVKDQRRFLDEIGVYGERGLAGNRGAERLDAMTAAGRFDTIPSGCLGSGRASDEGAFRSLSRIQAAIGTQQPRRP